MDPRDITLLQAIQKHPGLTLSELWSQTDLHKQGEGYGRPGERGRFNRNYCERACTRLRKVGILQNDRGWYLTPEGQTHVRI